MIGSTDGIVRGATVLDRAHTTTSARCEPPRIAGKKPPIARTLGVGTTVWIALFETAEQERPTVAMVCPDSATADRVFPYMETIALMLRSGCGVTLRLVDD